VCYSILLEMEAEYAHQNPLNSVTKLQNILQRCPKGKGDLEWVMTALWDGLRSNLYDGKSLTVSAIKGTHTSNKGMVTLFLLKRDLSMHLESQILGKLPFSTAAKVQLTRVFANHNTYRSMLKPLPTSVGGPDLTLEWASEFTKADMALRDFWEAPFFPLRNLLPPSRIRRVARVK
jgi:hypothetical protein